MSLGSSAMGSVTQANPAIGVRLSIITQSCTNSAAYSRNGDGYPLAIHPTQAPVGGSLDVGIVVWNGLIIVGFLTLYYTAIVVVSGFGLLPPSVHDPKGFLCFPSVPLFVGQCLYLGLCFGACRLIYYPTFQKSEYVGAFILALSLALPVALYRTVHSGVPANAVYRLVADIPDADFEKKVMRTDSASLAFFHTRFEWLAGPGEWVSKDASYDWVRRFGSLTRTFNQKFSWYASVECVTSLALAAIMSVQPNDVWGCGHLRIACAAVFYVRLATDSYLCPFAKGITKYFEPALDGVQALGLTVIAIAFYTVNTTVFAFGEYIMLFASLLLVTKTILEMATEAIVLWTGRRDRIQAREFELTKRALGEYESSDSEDDDDEEAELKSFANHIRRKVTSPFLRLIGPGARKGPLAAAIASGDIHTWAVDEEPNYFDATAADASQELEAIGGSSTSGHPDDTPRGGGGSLGRRSLYRKTGLGLRRPSSVNSTGQRAFRPSYSRDSSFEAGGGDSKFPTISSLLRSRRASLSQTQILRSRYSSAAGERDLEETWSPLVVAEDGPLAAGSYRNFSRNSSAGHSLVFAGGNDQLAASFSGSSPLDGSAAVRTSTEVSPLRPRARSFLSQTQPPARLPALDLADLSRSVFTPPHHPLSPEEFSLDGEPLPPAAYTPPPRGSPSTPSLLSSPASPANPRPAMRLPLSGSVRYGASRNRQAQQQPQQPPARKYSTSHHAGRSPLGGGRGLAGTPDAAEQDAAASYRGSSRLSSPALLDLFHGAGAGRSFRSSFSNDGSGEPPLPPALFLGEPQQKYSLPPVLKRAHSSQSSTAV
ncbi:hypothetical protein DIPPA_29232 [Diplonema papillatum]|nr:hypothetical protein DIPPA_29232 [Diplonema papillatum]